MVQVDLKKVVEHVCDTAGHLLKPRVSLEKMLDQTTPSIAGDGSRIVQVCIASPHAITAAQKVQALGSGWQGLRLLLQLFAAPQSPQLLLHLECCTFVAAPWLLHLGCRIYCCIYR